MQDEGAASSRCNRAALAGRFLAHKPVFDLVKMLCDCAPARCNAFDNLTKHRAKQFGRVGKALAALDRCSGILDRTQGGSSRRDKQLFIGNETQAAGVFFAIRTDIASNVRNHAGDELPKAPQMKLLIVIEKFGANVCRKKRSIAEPFPRAGVCKPEVYPNVPRLCSKRELTGAGFVEPCSDTISIEYIRPENALHAHSFLPSHRRSHLNQRSAVPKNYVCGMTMNEYEVDATMSNIHCDF